MKIVELNEIEFDRLAKCEPNASFYQTSNWAKYYAYQGYEPLYLGYLSDKNVYLAFAMILISKGSLLQGKQALCPSGFLINYFDVDLFSKFTKDLKKYLRKKFVSSLYIEPNIAYHASRVNNDLLISNLIKFGYQKTRNCKFFTMKTDKSIEIKAAKELVFNSYVVSDEKDKLFTNNEKCRYLKQAMGEVARFVVCELNCDNSVLNIQNSINEINEYLDMHQYDIDLNSINIKKQQLLDKQKLLESVNYLINKKGNNPILSVTCLIEYDNRITQIFIDDDKNYKEFYAFDVLYNATIDEVKRLGYDSFITYTQFDDAVRTELVGGFEYKI